MATIHKIENTAPQPAQQQQPRRRQYKKDKIYQDSLQSLTNRLLSVGDKQEKIDRSMSHINEFRSYVGTYPWEWTRENFEAFSAHLRKDLANATSTQRGKQTDIKQYMDYLTDSKYARIIKVEFGITLVPICDKDNMIVHKVENDNSTGRRNFTRAELNEFFQKIDDHIMILHNTASKEVLPAQRDKIVYMVMAKYGLRNNELVHLDIDHIGPNRNHPEFGNYGYIHVRYGKATKGSNPKQRIVWTTDIQAAEFLAWYMEKVRPEFFKKAKDKDSKALFLSERGTRLSKRSIEVNLKKYLKAFGMDHEELVPHSFRHSFITIDQENSTVNSHFVQKQSGHEYNATTMRYTHFEDDYHRKCLEDTINKKMENHRRRTAEAEQGTCDEGSHGPYP